MRICILTTSFPRFEGDFIANFFFEIAKRLKSAGHEVEVVCPHQVGLKKFENISGVNVYRFQYMPFASMQSLAYGDGMAKNIRAGWKKLIQFPFFLIAFLFTSLKTCRHKDIIIANFIPAALVGILPKKLYGIPLILTEHRLLNEKGILGLTNNLILRNIDCVIFNSNYTANITRTFKGIKKPIVIPVGIESSRFEEKNYRKKSKNFNIISIGRLIEKKGYPYLIEAISIVKKKYPNIKLTIIGWGELEKSLKLQIKNLNLESNVDLLGGVKPELIPKYIRDSDLFVLSSIIDSQGETETLGVVLIEAMACGIPVIGSNVGGITDVIVNEKTGFLVEPKSSLDIANKIIKLIESPSKRIEMGKNARIRAKEIFDWDSITKDYIKIAEEVKKDYTLY